MTERRQLQISESMNRSIRRSHSKADQWDRIRLHMIEGHPLRRKTDQELLKKSMQVWPLLCEGFPVKTLVEKLVEMEVSDNDHQARRLINTTKRIFGDAQAYNPEAEKTILIEMAKYAYGVAKEAGNAAAMAKCIKELRELQGHNEEHELSDLYGQLSLPDIIYTSDEAVLQEAPVKDAQYQEIESDAEPTAEEIPTP